MDRNCLNSCLSTPATRKYADTHELDDQMPLYSPSKASLARIEYFHRTPDHPVLARHIPHQ